MRKKKVILNPELVVHPPVAYLMEVRDDSFPARLFQDLQDARRIAFVRPFHQAADGLPHQPPAHVHDVDRHADGDDRIQPGYARKSDEQDADQHADARPHVRQHVLPVGNEHEIVVLLPGANQVETQRQVHDGERTDDAQTEVELLECGAVNQIVDGRDDDRHGGDQDKHPFESRRKIGNLAVSVWMARIGRLKGIPETEPDEYRRQKVHDRLHGVGEDRRAAGQEERRHLARQHEEGDGDAHGDSNAARIAELEARRAFLNPDAIEHLHHAMALDGCRTRSNERVEGLLRSAACHPQSSSEINEPMARLEHVGIAAEDVENALGVLSDLLGDHAYRAETVEKDAVRTHFIWGGSAKLEILESLHDSSAVSAFLDRRGTGVHHLAFEVDDVRSAFERAREAGYDPLDPEPRPGADGKLIFFLHPGQTAGILFEFCQTVETSLRPLDRTGGLKRAARAAGSPARTPCVYIAGSDPGLEPDSLAGRIAPGRTFITAQAPPRSSVADVLDALELDQAHVVVDAGAAASLVRAIEDGRVRSAVLLDPNVHDVEGEGAIHKRLLALTRADAAGLQRAATLRRRFPTLGLAVASDSTIRTAVIESYLERDLR